MDLNESAIFLAEEMGLVATPEEYQWIHRRFLLTIGAKTGSDGTISADCSCGWTFEAFGQEAPERAAVAQARHVRDKHLRQMTPWNRIPRPAKKRADTT